MRLRWFALLAALLLTACSSDDGPELKAEGDAGQSFDAAKVGQSIVVPMQPLCTTGDPIRITAVTALRPTGGLSVTSWGTRYLGRSDSEVEPNQGGIAGRVEQIAGFSPHHAVRSKCQSSEHDDENEDAPVDQFDVSVAASSSRASMRGVTITYGSGRRVVAHFYTVVCSTKTCPLGD